MIVWLNGAFGVGKTSVAECLCKEIVPAHLYDPEQVGYFLWENFPQEMRRQENFQHIALWRQFNYQILKYLYDSYQGLIVAPMTIYRRAYYDEIVWELKRNGVEVRHLILSASRRTILDRLIQRGDGEDSWAAQHIGLCLKAFEHEIPGETVDTEGKSIEKITDEIIRRIWPDTRPMA